jgi:hypothetical protein
VGCALALARGAGHVRAMPARRIPRRASEGAASHAPDSDWTEIVILVMLSVAIAVGAFFWFIA